MPWAVLLLASAAASAGAEAPFTGRYWLPDGNGQLELRGAGDSVIGAIACFEDTEAVDGNNPDAGLRDRDIVGLEILEGFVWNGRRGRWEAGSIYDPKSGNTYRSRLSMDDDGRLLALGYVGTPMLGRTATFDPVPETAVETGPRCSRQE